MTQMKYYTDPDLLYKQRAKNGQVPVAIREDGARIWGYDKQQPICNAKIKRNGVPGRCKRQDVEFPSGRCSRHGVGKASFQGAAHHNFIHGRRSKHVPSSFRKLLDEHLENKDYLSLKYDISFASARLEQLESRLEEGLDIVTIKALNALATRIRLAMTLKDPEKRLERLTACCREILAIADRGMSDDVLFGQIQKAQKHRAELIQMEISRLKAAEDSITRADAYNIIMAMMASIRVNVKDPDILRAIQADILALSRANHCSSIPGNYVIQQQTGVMYRAEQEQTIEDIKRRMAEKREMEKQAALTEGEEEEEEE